MSKRFAYSKYGKASGDAVAVSLIHLFGPDVKKGDSFIVNGKIVTLTRNDNRVIIHDKKLRDNLNTAKLKKHELEAEINELTTAVDEFAAAIRTHLTTYYTENIERISGAERIQAADMDPDEQGNFSFISDYSEIGIENGVMFYKIQYDSPKSRFKNFDISISYDFRTKEVIDYRMPNRSPAAERNAQTNLRHFL